MPLPWAVMRRQPLLARSDAKRSQWAGRGRAGACGREGRLGCSSNTQFEQVTQTHLRQDARPHSARTAQSAPFPCALAAAFAPAGAVLLGMLGSARSSLPSACRCTNTTLSGSCSGAGAAAARGKRRQRPTPKWLTFPQLSPTTSPADRPPCCRNPTHVPRTRRFRSSSAAAQHNARRGNVKHPQ